MTWSILSHDAATGALAVAVATCNFAVGASVPHIRAGVGAVASQSFSNRYLGPAILDAMARGLTPEAAIHGAMASDDGSGLRQVHTIYRHGRSAAWTGQVEQRAGSNRRRCGCSRPGISPICASVATTALAPLDELARLLALWRRDREPGLASAPCRADRLCKDAGYRHP